MPFPLLAILPVVGKLIDKLLPDPAAAAKAQLDLMKLAQDGELAWLAADVQLAVGQMEINKEEAKDPSLFKSGWRPGVGWLCVAGFGYVTILRPLLPWTATALGHPLPPLPVIETAELMTILMGLLGLGGMRTAERIKGKA